MSERRLEPPTVGAGTVEGADIVEGAEKSTS